MCACVHTTALRRRKSRAGGTVFRCSCEGAPWNRPKSTRTRALSVSSRVQLPVTSPAAPKNVKVGDFGTDPQHRDIGTYRARPT